MYPSRKGVPGRNILDTVLTLLNRGLYPLEQVYNDYVYRERPLAAHAGSEGVFKSSMLLLHPNVAEEVEQEASKGDVQQC